MENNMNNTENILFESKGMPTKIRKVLLICVVLLTFISLIFLVRVITLPTHDAFNTGIKSDTKMIDGKVVATFSTTPGITDDARNECMEVFGGILLIGVACISCVIAGRRFYFRIYENHIEGCSGFGFLSKNINISIHQIGELSSNINGLMPSLMIRTVYGNNVPIIMNKDKVIDAENILRLMLNSKI